jgi:hypothetical protein
MGLSETQYSENEVKLLSMFDVTKSVIGHVVPIVLYRMAVEEVFLQNLMGPHVEALRRGFDALMYSKCYRMTKEFDYLVSF